MVRKSALLALCTAALFTAACDRGATEPQVATLNNNDVAVVADGLDDMAWAILDSGFMSFGFGFGFSVSGTESVHLSSAPVPINTTFTRTSQCPKGGTVTVTATIKGEMDAATRSMTTTTTATKTDNACAFQGKDAVITVTGDPNLVLTSNRKIVNGTMSGPQTSTQKGGFKWSTSAGKSGTCQVDITSTIDPTAKTRTVTGTMCGKTVNVTRQIGGGK